MPRTLSDKGVAALKPRPSRYVKPDPQLLGHYVRVMPSGAKSFVTVARSPSGKQVWTTIGAADALGIQDAREQAREAIKRVRAGLSAIPAQAATFGDVAASWRKRHVEANGLRTASRIGYLLDKHVLPEWREREFTSIRRSEITALLDDVEDNHGARQADAILTIIRSLCNWYAARHDDYAVPTVRGMMRQSAAARARARVLDDDELRVLWHASETNGKLGAMVRLALLTAQRRAKIVTMRWADISSDGEWTIPKEPREKHAGGVLVLPKLAIDIVRAQSQMGDNPYVFAATRGNGPFAGLSKPKRALDAKLPKGTAPWTLHDLRRTARSLMSRVGISSEHAERVLGHVIPGVEGVYDRHSYRDEKADALRRLAALIDSIVHPRGDVVVPISKRAKRR
jgi:integrase